MSVTQGLTPETLTFDEIKRWSGQEMKDQMRRSDEMRLAVLNVISSRSLAEVQAAQSEIDLNAPPAEAVVTPTAEEAAAAEQQRLAAEAEAQRVAAQETARQAAETAETEQLRAAGITVQRDQYGNISKLIQDYQVADDNGNPIGRPTHFEARSWPELVAKQREAHSQATRAFGRLKSQKITFKEQQPIAPGPQTDAELLAAMKDLRSDDPQKQLDALRKVQKVESDKKDAEQAELARQAAVSRRFLTNHKEDFNNCKANIELIKEYFAENQELAWTDDNLEICLHALESKLAPVELVVPPAPVNPVPPVAPVIQPTAPVAVQPVVTVPALVVPPANPVAAAPRPGVNGGLIPGESSGSRPVVTNQKKKLTAEEIKSWSPETMKANMRNPQIRPLIDEFVRERNAQTRK
jgi:hypothetical protein